MIRQFDICPLRRRRGAATHVVVLQHDILDDLRTLLVAPLRPVTASEPNPRLRPLITVAGMAHALAVDMLSVIDRRELDAAVASAETSKVEIWRAIDMAFYGR